MSNALDDLKAKARALAAAKRASAALDRRIEEAYRKGCNGVQIDIMDIGKVFDFGRKAIAAGCDDTELMEGIRRFVDGIRKN